MPGTYHAVLLHVVFSTKARHPWLTSDVRQRLFPYIGGIIRAANVVPLNINGVEDHVHIYVSFRTDQTIADLMRTVKSRSSRWIHEQSQALSDFAWQEGYAVFSVSPSQDEAVRRYIDRQEEHHRNRDFKTELIELLDAHGIEYDPRYVFES